MTTFFVAMSMCDPSNLNWVLDSGVTRHMTPNGFILFAPQPHTGMSSTIVGNGYLLLISHQGSICLSKSPHFCYLI